MVQSLQPKGRDFESTHVHVFFFILFLLLFDSFYFIFYRCTTTSDLLDHLFKRLMRNAYTKPVCLEHQRATK